MKRLFTLLALAFTITASAQSFELIDPVNMVSGTLAELGNNGEMVVAWDVQNTSSNTLTVLARRIVNSAVQGSSNYFCWGVCFGEETNISPVQAAQIMDPGAINDSFYAHYVPEGNAGESVIQYCFFDNNNPSDEVCYTVQWCVDVECIVGVKDIEAIGTMEYNGANPLQGLGMINYAFTSTYDDAQIVIYNMMGQEVKSIPVNGKNGMVFIHANDFENGMYLYSLKVGNSIVETQRLIIAK